MPEPSNTPSAAPTPPQGAPSSAPSPGASHAPPDAPRAAQAPDKHGRTAADLAKGYARPYRDAAVHKQCGNIVVLGKDVAAEFAKSPGVLGTIKCPHCRAVRPVGEFVWHGTQKTDEQGAMTGSPVGG